MDLRPYAGWRITKGSRSWELRHDDDLPGGGAWLIADRPGMMEGLRDLLNAQFPTGRPSIVDGVRARLSAHLLRWSRRLDPEFWPEGRHGLHRPEPIGSWLPPSAQHTGAATYRSASADERP